MKRFRVLDFNTPWFWLVMFFRRQYGKPWLEASLYPNQRPLAGWWSRWWLYGLSWEDEPSRLGADVAEEERQQG